MTHIVHGIDYLNDHYALLGVGRHASVNEITHTYLTQSSGTQRAGRGRFTVQFKLASNPRQLALQLAYETLSDEKRRATYDTLLEMFPHERVSRTGRPPLLHSKRRVSLDHLLASNKEGPTPLYKDPRLLATGYLADTFISVETAYTASAPNLSVRKLYLPQLLAKHAYLQTLEDIEWNRVGVFSQPRPEQLLFPEEYESMRHKQIEEYLAELPHLARLRILAQLSGNCDRELPLYVTHGKDASETLLAANLSTEQLTNQARDMFSARRPHLEHLAHENTLVLEKLTNLTDWEYYPKEQALFPELLVLIHTDNSSVEYVAYGIRSQRIEQIELPLKINYNNTEWNSPDLKSLLHQYQLSCTVLKINPGFEQMLQLSHVIHSHFSQFFDEDGELK